MAQPVRRDVARQRRTIAVTCLDVGGHRMQHGLDLVVQTPLAEAAALLAVTRATRSSAGGISGSPRASRYARSTPVLELGNGIERSLSRLPITCSVQLPRSSTASRGRPKSGRHASSTSRTPDDRNSVQIAARRSRRRSSVPVRSGSLATHASHACRSAAGTKRLGAKPLLWGAPADSPAAGCPTDSWCRASTGTSSRRQRSRVPSIAPTARRTASSPPVGRCLGGQRRSALPALAAARRDTPAGPGASDPTVVRVAAHGTTAPVAAARRCRRAMCSVNARRVRAGRRPVPHGRRARRACWCPRAD